jgi:hypothetical protein
VNLKKIFSVVMTSHTPDHIMNHNIHTGVEPSERYVCKEIFFRHSSLSLPLTTYSGHKSHEDQEY